MTDFEKLNLLVSILAIIIAAVSMFRTRKVEAKNIELAQITANLATKQLQQIEQYEQNSSKAQIDVDLISDGNNSHFIITNIGGAEATNVYFGIEGASVLVPSEHESKIPVSSLRPGKSIELLAAISQGTPPKFKALWRWNNPDGSTEKDEIEISW